MFSQRAIDALKEAESLVVLTGAGVSAESGVPTFRGAGGLWREYSATSLATPEAFRDDPRLVWEFYNYRREVLTPLAPNPGHYAIASMEERFARFTLITQNIDNLHRVAGTREIVELHGNIWRVRCTNLGCERATLSRGRTARFRSTPCPQSVRRARTSCVPTWCGSARCSTPSSCAGRWLRWMIAII